MIMKKIVMMLAVLMMSSAAMMAQPPRGGHHGRGPMNPEKMVEQRVDRLDKALSLTTEQKTAITTILQEEQGQMKAQFDGKAKGERPSQEEMQAHQEAMKAQRAATDAKIKQVLTPDQQAKYDELQAQGPRGNKDFKKGKPGKKHDKRGKGDKKKDAKDCCGGEQKACSCSDKATK